MHRDYTALLNEYPEVISKEQVYEGGENRETATYKSI